VNWWEADAVVTAHRSDWSRVTDTEELMGVLYSLDALPQYLIHAILVGAVTVSMWIMVLDFSPLVVVIFGYLLSKGDG